MKTANKIISILTLFLIMIVSSCDMLQSTLSSEMNKELTAQTGSGSVVEKTFYYNGSKAADLLTTGDFKIDFGKKVVISKDGLVGKFLVTYTDENSNISTVELKLGSNNELSLDCTELYLDMKPVLEYLKEKNVDNATVEISVSGLICNEGEQKGRNVSAFKETIKVQPLFSKISDISVSTKNAPAGFTFEIPLNGKVVLTEDAYVDCADYDLELVGLGADGKSIVIKTNEDLTAKEFSSGITVTGITPISSGNGYSVDLGLVFNSSVISSDTLDSSEIDISSIEVKKDTENLYVTLNFESSPTFWNGYRPTVMIDYTRTTGETELLGAWDYGAANNVNIKNGDIDLVLSTVNGTISNSKGVTITSSPAIISDESGGFVIENSGTKITYSIPLTTFGDTIEKGQSFKVVACTSVYAWVNDSNNFGIKDCSPAVAFEMSGSVDWVTNTVTTIDMSKALEYVIE